MRSTLCLSALHCRIYVIGIKTCLRRLKLIPPYKDTCPYKVMP